MELVEVVEHGKDLDNTAMLSRLQSKGVQYVISQTVQSPVATMLKDAQRLGIDRRDLRRSRARSPSWAVIIPVATTCVSLAGSAAENFYWTTSYKIDDRRAGPGKDYQLALAKRYGRDEKRPKLDNYTNGIMVAQVAAETIRRAKAKGQKVTRASFVRGTASHEWRQCL